MKNRDEIKGLHGLVLGLLVSTLACGPSGGFKTTSTLSNCDGGNCSTSTGDGNNGPSHITAADLQGSITGGALDAVQVISYDKATKSLQFKIPLINESIQFEVEIPNVAGAHVSVGPDATTGMTVAIVTVPLALIAGKLKINPAEIAQDPTKLPNGNALPAFPGGEGPTIAFKVPRVSRDIYVYLGINVFAVFVATPSFDPFVFFQYPIKNRSQKEIIGYFATIPKKSPSSGGFYISLLMPKRIANFLDDIL